MKNVAKIFAVVLTFIFMFSFTACNQEPDNSTSTPPAEIVVTPGPAGEQVVEKVDGNTKYLQNKVEQAGRVKLEKTSDCPADFTINVEGEEPLKILQITDTQMIDHTQVRLGNGAVSDRYANRDQVMYDILDYVIDQTQPDLILLTGDYVYGDYDDNGSCFREQTDYFDSKGVYWAPIYGNHDNDSDSDYAVWLEEGWEEWYGRKQCQYFENATHCLFRTRTAISGYSNFSIAIKQNGEFVRTVFMIDTHGSHHTEQGIRTVQLNWFKETVNAINEYAGKTLPSYVGIHVPIYAFKLAAQQYGYTSGTFVVPENDNGDFGHIRQNPASSDNDGNLKAFNTFKENGTDAILAGHLHKNNSCITYEGVKLVFGTKSSRYDKYDEDLLGGTLFTGAGADFTVAPIYYTDSTVAE